MDGETINTKPLTRERILAAEDLARELVPVPEWGGAVFVRPMTGRQRDRFEGLLLAKRYEDIRAHVAAWCACDEHGQALFKEADVPALSNKSAAALQRIYDAAVRVSKVRKEDVDELEGESGAVHSSSTATS